MSNLNLVPLTIAKGRQDQHLKRLNDNFLENQSSDKLVKIQQKLQDDYYLYIDEYLTYLSLEENDPQNHQDHDVIKTLTD